VTRYDILDTPPDAALDRIAAMAARVFGVPMATVSIVDTDRVWFKASLGLAGVHEIASDPGLCASVVLDGKTYHVTDARTDPRTAEHPLVTGEPGLRFYAAARSPPETATDLAPSQSWTSSLARPPRNSSRCWLSSPASLWTSWRCVSRRWRLCAPSVSRALAGREVSRHFVSSSGCRGYC